LFVITLAERVDKETFLVLLTQCKAADGFYLQASKKAGVSGGFAFTDEDKAVGFSKEIGGLNKAKSSSNGKVSKTKKVKKTVEV
jgi:hypothetical protein